MNLISVFIVLLAFIIFGAIFIQSIAWYYFGGNNITESTRTREPLDKKYVTVGNGKFYEDHIGWIRSPAVVNKGLRYFFDETGVMPYLVITEEVYGNYHPTGEEVYNYAAEKYDELFHDEGHMVFVFQSIDNSDYYTMAACTGAQAKIVIDDDEALEILYDYFDANWWTDKDEDHYFADSFQSAARRIMNKQTDVAAIVKIGVYVVAGIYIVLLIVQLVKSKRSEQSDEEEVYTGASGYDSDPGSDGL